MRSTSDHCFLIGTAAVSWSSKKQATVALSSTEAEYVAAITLACQAIWLRRLFSDLGEEQEHATGSKGVQPVQWHRAPFT
ncbi:hypothetical protein Tco_0314709 [Tanacetum coccineum]